MYLDICIKWLCFMYKSGRNFKDLNRKQRGRLSSWLLNHNEIKPGPGRRKILRCKICGLLWIVAMLQNQGISWVKCVVVVAFWRWMLIAGVFALYIFRRSFIWSQKTGGCSCRVIHCKDHCICQVIYCKNCKNLLTYPQLRM
jgi:hypothetical protein